MMSAGSSCAVADHRRVDSSIAVGSQYEGASRVRVGQALARDHGLALCVRESILALSVRRDAEWHDVLWRGRRLPATASRGSVAFEIADVLQRAGLLRVVNGFMSAPVQVWTDGDLVIVSDRPDYGGVDRVFPVFSDESLALLEFAKFEEWRSVLEIGTGSGILALGFAHSSSRTVSVDVNPRAIEFATASATLNPSIRQPVLRLWSARRTAREGLRTDLVVSNPPFSPVPPRHRFHIAGSGGELGVRVIRDVFRCYRESARTSGGSLLMLGLSLCRRGVPLVLDVADELLGEGVVQATPVYPDRVPLADFCAEFAAWDPNCQWTNSLFRRGFDEVGYYLFSAGPVTDTVAQHGVNRPTVTRLSGTWEGRFTRYRSWQTLPCA
jgi:SAM-dependent methyltransferase